MDPNPLIRALAVCALGCIRVEKITEYLCDPLQRTLTDEDPYVRKTAPICVAKLHDINPELVEDRGFVDQLRELLADANPMVVANAVAALTEIDHPSAWDYDASSSSTRTTCTSCWPRSTSAATSRGVHPGRAASPRAGRGDGRIIERVVAAPAARQLRGRC